MKSSATQTITVTHISEVSLFRHDLSHLKVQKSMSSSVLLLEHFFNRIWTESAQYLKEYNAQSSGLLMILYFLCTLKAWIQKRLAWIQVISSTYSFLISNSFDLVVLLEPPRAMQSWGNRTHQSLHICYMYSGFILGCSRLEEVFWKLALYYLRVQSSSTTKLKPHRLHTQRGLGWGLLSGFVHCFYFCWFLLLLELQI